MTLEEIFAEEDRQVESLVFSASELILLANAVQFGNLVIRIDHGKLKAAHLERDYLNEQDKNCKPNRR